MRGHVSSSPDVVIRLTSWSTLVDDKGDLNVTVYVSVGMRFCRQLYIVLSIDQFISIIIVWFIIL